MQLQWNHQNVLSFPPIHVAILTVGQKDSLMKRHIAISFPERAVGNHDVVVCFGPLFLSDHWQLLVTALEIYRYYDVSIHIFYIQSMLTEMADLLRIYEARSYVKIGPWAKVDRGGDLSISYDPNTELNWTNQESALCDCLLSYKDSSGWRAMPMAGVESNNSELKSSPGQHPESPGVTQPQLQATYKFFDPC
ncbi:UPF0392 protein F59C6.8 [Toxocara canis]|uniref:Glycosyltransferase family 92 protein n=1 Tax=Toxocara canis TaxID=6265 RepID=A0A0B2W038_TOXCA|nr:UPF0392 protein F59C6.8 [Toxocara canis]